MNDLISFELPKTLPNREMIVEIGRDDSETMDYIMQQEIRGMDFYALNIVDPNLQYSVKF